MPEDDMMPDVQESPDGLDAQDTAEPEAELQETQPDSADNEKDIWAWDDDADQEEDSAADVADDSGEEAPEDEQQEEYEFDLGEQTKIPAELHGELGGLAKELGIPGDKAAELLNKGLAIYQARYNEQNRELGAELRKEWGKNFAARLKSTQAFAARLGREAGLKAADMGVLMSPYGIRLLDAMRAKLSEGGGFAGRGQVQPKLTRQQQIDAFHANSDKMAAILDPTHPLFDSANAELNRLYGID